MQQLRHVRDPRSGEMKRIQLTTAQTLEGFRVKQTIEIVSAECVLGMSAFSDMFSGFRDLAGGRSKSYQRHLREAKDTCLYELRAEADRVGANAVIAVDLDYSEISGGGKSMLFLVANGTAVVVEPVTGT
jgi:uncharacterized protein YbjQ (UPF0145 family)